MELQGGRSCQKENDHAISMVLAMIIAFFVCWLPYTALSVVVVVDPELHIPPLVATMPMYFAKTSPVYNPIIYFLSNKQVSSSAANQMNDWRQNLISGPFVQFRDATLEMLSCGRYIPHAPTRVTINMRSFHRRSRLTSLSRSINTHSKVSPL